MQRTKAELTEMKMLPVYYIRLILCIFPIATLAVSLVYIILTSPKIWLDAVGSNLLVANLFNCIFSIVSFVFILLCIIGVKSDAFFVGQIFFVFSVLSFILSFITLSLSSQKSFSQNVADITDYCVRHPENSFCLKDGTPWGIKKYTQKRTTYMYDWCAGITAPHVSIFLFYIILCSTVPSKKRVFIPHPKPIRGEKPNNDNIVNQFEPDNDNNANQFEPDRPNENNDHQALLNHDDNVTQGQQEGQRQQGEERLNIEFSDSYEGEDSEIALQIRKKPQNDAPASPVTIQLTDPQSQS